VGTGMTRIDSSSGDLSPTGGGRTGLWALAAVMLLAVSTACATSQPGPTASASVSASATSVAGSDSTANASSAAAIGTLLASGLQVVSAEGDPPHVGSALRFTDVQARRLIADVGPGSGLLGRDIDRLAPVAAGVPPVSFLVAAWVSSGRSAAASTALGWMGSQDWTKAPTLHFPLAVLAMFVSEMANATDREMPPDDAGQSTTQSSTSATVPTGSASGFARIRHSSDVRIAPCSAVTGFLASVIQGLFGALRITPSSGSGVFDFLASTLASIWNVAVGLAQAAVEGLVKKLNEFVFEAVRVAVGALGVATVIVSYFKDEALTVDLAVPQVDKGQYPFAVDAAADVTGQFVAKSRELTGDWPSALIDCAKVAGAALPELIKPGVPATWTVDDVDGVVTPGSLTGTVTADHTATLSFVTGRESADDVAHGQEVLGDAIATVKIPRKEIDDFLAFATAQVAGVRANLLAAAGPFQLATAALLASTVDPVAKQITDEISGAAGAVFTLSGSAVVFVLHHTPPDTTTSASTPPASSAPPPASDGQGDFCTQYKALVDWVRANPPGDVIAWANEIVRRLNALRPLAPSDLGADVDVELGVYSAVAASANAQVLVQRAAPLADASQQLGTFCGVPVS
jgi:hypothetical protein